MGRRKCAECGKPLGGTIIRCASGARGVLFNVPILNTNVEYKYNNEEEEWEHKL